MDDRLPEPPPYSGDRFCEFQLVSIEELSNLVGSSGFKSCALDPIPAQVLKGCLDLLLPFITQVVNRSLECGVMAEVDFRLIFQSFDTGSASRLPRFARAHRDDWGRVRYS